MTRRKENAMKIEKTTSQRTEKHPDTALPIYGAAESGQKQEPRKGGGEDDSSDGGGGSTKLAKKGEKLKEDMDALVDEIDEVLEENAEEFVKNYVQRGGE
jgi:ubiquitin-like protein Pup